MTALGEMTIEEAIEHFGVKGMHWGSRKSSGTSSGGKGKTTKPAKEKVTTQQIYDARGRRAAHLSKIYEADRDLRLATTKKGKDAALKVVEKHAKEFNNPEDVRIAGKYTRGEKVVATVLLGPVGIGLIALNSHATKKK